MGREYCISLVFDGFCDPDYTHSCSGLIEVSTGDAMTAAKVRILVADDNERIRTSLSSVLRSRAGWIVCGEATDGKDAVEKAIDLKPDVILVDLSMPYLNGFEVAACIHEQLPDAEILVVTEHDSRVVTGLPCQPGVRGYVVKSRIDRDLIGAVEAASKHRPLPAPTAA